MKHVLLSLAVGFGVIALLLITMIGARAQSQSPSTSALAKSFTGTWKLVSYASTDQETMRARGSHATGLIVYDATGHMAVQIMPERARRRFTGSAAPLFNGPRPTAEEALDAVTGYVAYFGTYTLDERAGTVTHHRQGNLISGQLGDFVRRYTFVNGDRLLLIPLENQGNQLTWERLK